MEDRKGQESRRDQEAVRRLSGSEAEKTEDSIVPGMAGRGHSKVAPQDLAPDVEGQDGSWERRCVQENPQASGLGNWVVSLR